MCSCVVSKSSISNVRLVFFFLSFLKSCIFLDISFFRVENLVYGHMIFGFSSCLLALLWNPLSGHSMVVVVVFSHGLEWTILVLCKMFCFLFAMPSDILFVVTKLWVYK